MPHEDIHPIEVLAALGTIVLAEVRGGGSHGIAARYFAGDGAPAYRTTATIPAGAGGDVTSGEAGCINVVVTHDAFYGHRDETPSSMHREQILSEGAIVAAAVAAIA